jgi:trehalose synthase-fused probable maltokinase
MSEIPDLARRGDLSFLDPETLQEWVVAQRWFGSKSRQVSALEVLQGVPLRSDEPLLVLALVSARFPAGTHDLYQLPLGLRPASDNWDKGVIAEVDGWTVYDALVDPVHGRELLERMRHSSVAAADDGTLAFRWAGDSAEPNGSPEVRPIGVEQSNSSMVFGDALVLKSFRRLEPGVNPELELLRFLDEHGFENIAPLAGWYEYEGRLVDSTLGILQQYLKGARDGWDLAVSEDGEDPDRLIERLEDLGAVTGRMHSVLGSDAGDLAFAPDEPTDEGLALITATVDEEIERIFKDLPEDDESIAPIAGRGQDVRERLGQMSRIGVAGRVIRTHGDYHLGQVMLTERGWVVLDFEGEPARTLPERRQKRSPLRDVAGMLRSFSYVAAAADILGTRTMPEDWEERARAAFLEGYFREVDPNLLPPGQESTEKLLSVFELEKAVYELNYEINNRPDWVGIPVASIARLLEAE